MTHIENKQDHYKHTLYCNTKMTCPY